MPDRTRPRLAGEIPIEVPSSTVARTTIKKPTMANRSEAKNSAFDETVEPKYKSGIAEEA